jgi:hypothetical protein
MSLFFESGVFSSYTPGNNSFAPGENSMLRSLLSVIAGYAAIALLISLLTLVAVGVMLGGDYSVVTPAYLIVNFSYGAVCALAGGYLTAWLARRKAMPHAAALAGLMLVMGVIGLFTPMEGQAQPLWYALGITAVGVIFALAGGYLRARQIREA